MQGRNEEQKPAPESAYKATNSNFARDFFSSVTAGTAIAYSTFMFEGLKKRLQTGQKISWKFSDLFAGSTSFAVSITPTTTIQMTADSVMKRYMPDDASPLTKLMQSAFCGIQGAIVATPVENIIIRQQMAKAGPKWVIKDMYNQGGMFRFWKTFNLIATRDGIFTACMLFVNDKVVTFAKDKFGSKAEYPALLAVSAIGAGLSHPFDTIATNRQKDHAKTSLVQFTSNFINQHGYKGLYKGIGPRFGLFFAFSNLIPFFRDYSATNIYDKHIANSSVASSGMGFFGRKHDAVKVEEVVADKTNDVKPRSPGK